MADHSAGEPPRAIPPRTKSERMALLTGFTMALEVVAEHGLQAARRELALMAEFEDDLPE